MARIDDLLNALDDQGHAERIRSEIEKIRRHRKFGLVFEGHEPETVTTRATIRIGHEAMLRREPNNHTKFLVEAVEDGQATIVSKDGEERQAPVEDLLSVLSFEDPIVPGLTHLGGIRRSDERPSHTVINGENFHALHALLATHAGKVDVIYIDPPYNTGDKSWKYNNRFVDDNDSYAHSKWLSFMERRLKLAKELLTEDGVLLVTIDEHEVHHLGVLLEQLAPGCFRQMATIVVNHAGVSQGALSRVEEYCFFVFMGEASVSQQDSDYLTRSKGSPLRKPVYWYSLVRSGTNADPSDRPNLVYPVLVDSETAKIVGVGESSLADLVADGELGVHELNDWMPALDEKVGGYEVAWPVRSDGRMGNWRVGRETLRSYISEGFVRAGRFDAARGTLSITYLKTGTIERIRTGALPLLGRDPDTGAVQIPDDLERLGYTPKTVWVEKAHDAGKQGSVILRELLGKRAFDFPKSPYAVFDTLSTVIRERPNCMVLDFFAGSGTTMHSVAMLNRRDGGRRSTILITNNDVSDSMARSLNRAGSFPGDPEFESEGIFESVTRPRIETAMTGTRRDGTRPNGSYLDTYLPEHELGDGFEENVEFFRLDYLTQDVVLTGQAFAQIIPLLWMQAGSVGEWDSDPGDAPWSMPESSNYAVLFDPDRIADFLGALSERDDISHIWVDTSSQAILRQVRSDVPPTVHVARLYDDYLRDVERRPRRALQ